MAVGALLGCSETRGPGTQRTAELKAAGQSAVTVCPGSGGFCFRDTTRGYVDQVMANVGTWIVFGEAGDSLSLWAAVDTLDASSDTRDLLSMASLDLYVSKPAAGRISSNPVPSPTGVRLASRGSYHVQVSLLGPPPGRLPYDIRLSNAASGKTGDAGLLAPSGNRARLVIDGEGTGLIAVIPNSVVRGMPAKEYADWGVWHGDYSILLTSDTLYHMCRLPCDKLDPVVLKDGAMLRRRY